MNFTHIFHMEVLGFLYVLAGTIAWLALTRRINLTGLLTQKPPVGTVSTVPGQFSAGRVQLLLSTIFMCASYLGEVAKVKDGNLPNVSNEMLYVFGGSSGIYALEKAWVMWSQNKKGSGGQ